MRPTLKSKLYLGFSFLFAVIVIIWIFSSVYIFKLSSDSDSIFRDNYKSVVAAKYLSLALDEMKDLQSRVFFDEKGEFDPDLYQQKINDFAKNLRDEENNITEAGERELVTNLKSSFEEYRSHFDKIRSDSLYKYRYYYFDLLREYTEVKRYISGISDLNMDAIIRKNSILKQTSSNAFLYISILGTVFFLISFTILMNFPRNVTEPLKELTRGIREIARKNYSHQLYINSGNEFGELAEAFNTMVIKLNEFEKSNLSKILFEKKRIEAIISNIRDAVIGLDENRNIIFANPAACELLNIPPAELIGKYAPDVAARNDLFQHMISDLVNNTYQTKEFSPMKIITGDKESYFAKDIFDVITQNNGNGEQQLVGHVIILKNITKFQEMDDAKTNFMATVSHELKNPIASARMNLKLLEDNRVGAMNDEQHTLLRNVRDELNRILKITGELLDLTQVETGNIQLHVQPVDPKVIVDYAIQSVRHQAEQKNIMIEQEIPAEVSLISADVEKTAWVLINFLNNAINYSDEKTKVILRVARSEKEATFSVRDFGPGIEEKYLDKIFERFFRVPGSTKTGTGLGLTISKEFISKQKGRIWVESTIGEGSTFYFTIPVA
jgi:signal transduction histidine kinase